jgi:hypothetical protein
MFQLYSISFAAYINIWLEQGFCHLCVCVIVPDQHTIIVLGCRCVSELTFGISCLFQSLLLHLLACTQSVSISGVKMYLISNVVKDSPLFWPHQRSVIFLQHIVTIILFGVIARISSSDPHIFRYEYSEFIVIKFQITSLLHPLTEVTDVSTCFGLMLFNLYWSGGLEDIPLSRAAINFMYMLLHFNWNYPLSEVSLSLCVL